MGAAANPECSRLAQYEVFSHRATDTNSYFVELRNSDTTRPFGRSQAIALEKPNEGAQLGSTLLMPPQTWPVNNVVLGCSLT